VSLLSISLRTSGRADADLRDHALGVVGFDADAEIADRCSDAAVLPFPLLASSLRASGPVCEVWRASGSVERGRHGAIRYTRHGAIRYTRSEAFLWGRLVLDETEFADDMANVAQAAYACMRDFVAECGYPHLLRVWNYFGAITQGEGDDERYKQFCVGRARSFLPSAEGFPAATAIGFLSRSNRHRLPSSATALPLALAGGKATWNADRKSSSDQRLPLPTAVRSAVTGFRARDLALRPRGADAFDLRHGGGGRSCLLRRLASTTG